MEYPPVLKTLSYQGTLCLTSGNEGEELLGIAPIYLKGGRVQILAEQIYEDLPYGSNLVSVRYWIIDHPFQVPNREVLDIMTMESYYGIGEADYGAHYSEITGYLWTDEEFILGQKNTYRGTGHNLIAELKSAIGKYLYLEIDLHDSKKLK